MIENLKPSRWSYQSFSSSQCDDFRGSMIMLWSWGSNANVARCGASQMVMVWIIGIAIIEFGGLRFWGFYIEFGLHFRTVLGSHSSESFISRRG